MKDIHDRGYKKLFSNLEIFRQLIMAFVRQSWVKDLDFSKCETTDKQAVTLLVNWFKQFWFHGRIDEADYKALEHVYHDSQEVAMMLEEAIKKEKKKFYNQGMEKGMEKIAKLMLMRGEPHEKIRSYTGLSADAIKRLKVKISQH